MGLYKDNISVIYEGGNANQGNVTVNKNTKDAKVRNIDTENLCFVLGTN